MTTAAVKQEAAMKAEKHRKFLALTREYEQARDSWLHAQCQEAQNLARRDLERAERRLVNAMDREGARTIVFQFIRYRRDGASELVREKIRRKLGEFKVPTFVS